MPELPTIQSTSTRRVRRYRNGEAVDVEDYLVVEEPLEIRVGDRRFTVTMRTPGDDFDLVRGLLFTEGLINSADDIGQMRYCDAVDLPPAPSSRGGDIDSDYDNIVVVRLKSEVDWAGRQWQRTLMSGTSCGLCGKAALDAVMSVASPIQSEAVVERPTLSAMAESMRSRQPVFDRTGGLHAAGLFDVDGNCLAVYEDIGRHNATDKVIGRALVEGWLRGGADALRVNGTGESCPSRAMGMPPGMVLLVSGRASFEITQKALVVGIPIVASVSAASTLAVDVAVAGNMTLIGFLRGGGMTVYAGADRIRG